MKTALDDLFSTGKGILALALLAGATVLCSLGRMPIEQWQNFAEWIFGSYAGAVAITKAATALASRPTAPAVQPAPAAAASTVVLQPPADAPKGFAALGLLVAIAAVGAALLFGGCAGISADTAVNTATSMSSAADAAFLAYDHQHEADLLAASSTRVEFDAKLATYLKKRRKVDDALLALRDAIDLARTAKDSKSFAAIAPAALAFEQAVTALKEDLQ